MSSLTKNLSVVFAVVLAVVVVVLGAAWAHSNQRVQALLLERTAANAALAVPPRTVVVALPAPKLVPLEPTDVPPAAPTAAPVTAAAATPEAPAVAPTQADARQPPPAINAVLNPLLSAAQPRGDLRELTDHDVAVQELVVLERRLSTGDVSTATATLNTAEPVLNGFAQMRVRNARMALENKDLTTARSELLAAIGEASRTTP
ncbi:MAG: hypothetical protein JNG84_03020 [Archangium sp.]|nr:hypothetical protein [Archangium sp.]